MSGSFVSENNSNMVKESIPLCIFLGSVAGVLEVVSRLVVAYPYHLERKKARELLESKAKSGENKDLEGQKLSYKFPPSLHRLMVVANVSLQLLSTSIHTVSTFFGPVSIDLPTILGSAMVSNALLFGPIFQIEVYSARMWAGTGLVFVGTFLLPRFGPRPQEHEDILEYLSEPLAATWSSIIGVSLIWSAICLVVVAIRGGVGDDEHDRGLKPRTWYAFVLILVAQLGEAVVTTTAAKMFVLVDGMAFWLALVSYILASAVAVYAFLLQATALTQGVFVPIMASSTVIVNGLTGLIVWEDWRVIQSWAGYVLVFVLLVAGNFLVASYDPNVTHNLPTNNHRQKPLRGVSGGEDTWKVQISDIKEDEADTVGEDEDEDDGTDEEEESDAKDAKGETDKGWLRVRNVSDVAEATSNAAAIPK